MFESFKTARALRDHEERIELVERHLKALKIEWADTLDRLKQTMGRLIKERARAERATEMMEPEGTEPVPQSEESALNERQQAINAGILARRRRLT